MRPITAQPGYTASDTVALLASRQFAIADVYTITPKYGSPILFTGAQQDVTIQTPVDGGGPLTYLSRKDVQIDAIRLKLGIGVEIDEQDMGVKYNESALLEGIPWGKALRLGRLDGATIKRDRFVTSRFAQPWIGGFPMFRGRISSLDAIWRGGANVKVKSDLVLLNTRTPKDLYQPNCVHTLYDPGCTLDKDDFDTAGTVGSGSTSQAINWAGASSDFSLGFLYIDTPEGITLVRTIREATGTQLLLAYPLDFVPATGTSFTAYPGCDRTYARCGEFANQVHFKGFPFVPVAETAF